MNVRELIEELNKVADKYNTTVIVSVRSAEDHNTMASVSEVNLIDDMTILLDTINPDNHKF